MTPKITVLLCTVRGNAGYVEHPEWHTIYKVIDDLKAQTFQDFELVVVDGLFGTRHSAFKATHVAPRSTIWTRARKVAISTYRNTGLVHAQGELVVNLDDCCELPPNYLETFWHVWNDYGVCLAMLWPESGDNRAEGRVMRPGQVYGFGSYPLAKAVEINGYDESFDGGQGLEDVDWSWRLMQAGVQFGLMHIEGFRIHAQSGHDPSAIDLREPFVKCCNPAWQMARSRNQIIANRDWTRAQLEKLVGPCHLLRADDTCDHHQGMRACAYLDRPWVRGRHPLCEEYLSNKLRWPLFDLMAERKKAES